MTPWKKRLTSQPHFDAYDSVGAAAEEADARALAAGDPPRARWIAVCEAVRAWALEHPHEYALVHGSPVPGYSAPADTIGPASRVGNAFIAIARDAYEGRGLALPPLPAALRPDADRMTADFAEGLPPEVTAALVAAWASWSCWSRSSCSAGSPGGRGPGRLLRARRRPARPRGWGCPPYEGKAADRGADSRVAATSRSSVCLTNAGGSAVQHRPPV
ncbi:hypothetical protein BGK67_05055 [Streptomyces subrutilus]|uniref:HTH-type transcriptional regulator MT1864/Rv1816-like C-terminal domain-containing protein n=1 Tax=Streptomyces subrutilus TaxID=36818 RepID=A0A1E5PMP0_9ACTN|nr:hypothetical protein BGK67_05055 [Streptomyces subrutilus]